MDRYVEAEARASFYEDHSYHYLTLHHTSFAQNVLYLSPSHTHRGNPVLLIYNFIPFVDLRVLESVPRSWPKVSLVAT